MADPITPVLYYRTAATKTTDIDLLPAAQKIVFDGPRDLQLVVSGGTGNILTEPEHSPSGEKTYHKQQVGGISENLRLRGNIDIAQSADIEKLRSFFRMAQLEETDFKYGTVGFFHHLLDFFNVDPGTAIGYTIEPPEISFGEAATAVHFDVYLSLGGKNLT